MFHCILTELIKRTMMVFATQILSFCFLKSFRPTCPDAIFERVSAVHQDLLQGLRLVRELQVEALHALQELMRVVEVQHFGGTVEGLLDVIGEDVDDLQQKLYGRLLSIFGRQQV